MGTVSVIGAGAWGTALAVQAARMNHPVTMWALEADVVADINERNANSLYLGGAKLPKLVRATSDMAEAVADAELVILVPPSKHLRSIATKVAKSVPTGAIVAVASKGIEEANLKLMSEVLAETMPDVPEEQRAFLGGPSFAKEVAAGLPTDIVIASTGAGSARVVQEMLHSPLFRVYTSNDPVGVEIGGAIKNVIAVATGACDGLGFGANSRAALITRGLAEITRLGVTLGADPLTFLGLAGMGDLVLTCTGDLSRNRQLGLKVAEGVDPKSFLASQRTVAEGFFTSHAAYELAKKRNVDMPITEQVYHVLHEGRPLLEAIKLLVTREFKDELRGIK
jgi:glycerol-3-phosphate dehydrogenase (NAD(P)+)